MSYILDALKKSEQERKQGQVPTLDTVQGLPSSRRWRRRISRLYLLIGLLLILALPAGIWLIWHPVPPTSPAPVVPTSTDTTDVSTSETAIEPTSESAVSAGSSYQAQEVTETALTQSVVMTTSETTPSAPPKNTPEPAPEVEADPSGETAPAVPAEGPAETSEPDDGADQEFSQEPEENVLAWEELPVGLKSELPEIRIGAHLYTDNQATRRVSINGLLLHQGQKIAAGLTLVEVTREGIVLSYQGQKFSMTVFRR